MPSCPHCSGYYFGEPLQCPKCNYDFKLKRVVSKEEAVKKREELRIAEEKAREQKAEIIRKREEEAIENRMLAFQNSALYEYTTVYLRDSYSGLLNQDTLNSTLQSHAAEGWRLHSVLTNEAGKNSSSVSVGGASFGTNATMDVTILIFERCIKLAGQS